MSDATSHRVPYKWWCLLPPDPDDEPAIIFGVAATFALYLLIALVVGSMVLDAIQERL